MLDALAHIKPLSGLIPTCAYCKRVRDDRNYWRQVEGYISRRTDARFAHGYCPECLEKQLPGLRDASQTGQVAP